LSWTEPTAADLKAAFPSFEPVPDATVDYWLTRAARTVDADWPDEDGPHARMLLAAHLMTQQGLGGGAEAEAFAAGTTGFRRLRSGALDLERFDRQAASDLGTTAYGLQFLPLFRSLRSGPRVTGTGALPCDTYGRHWPW
jgi:hypothetical protein